MQTGSGECGGGWGDWEMRGTIYEQASSPFFFLYENNIGLTVSETRGMFCFRLSLSLFCIEMGSFV